MSAALACGVALTLASCVDDPLDIAPPSSCDLPTQKAWVLDVMRQVYLWTDDLPSDVDLEAYETPEELLADLRQGEDRWSRVADKVASDALFMEGKYVGLGMSTARDAEDRLRITFVHEESPAGVLGLTRGQVIWSVGGKTVAQRDADNDWEDAWGENEVGVSATVEVHDPSIAAADVAASDLSEYTVTRDWVQIVTVPRKQIVDVGSRKVGYLLFWTFVDIAYDELEDTFYEFKNAGVDTIIVDLRYNGGGLVAVSRYVMNLLVGATQDGHVAYSVSYNSNLSSENNTRYIEKQNASFPLDRVFFLTSKKTLSASELVINSVDPLIDVTIVGATTGGKPVGSHSFEFCEKLLYPITFRFKNSAGASDYFDGLGGECPIEEDLAHDLGDPEEVMFAAALDMIGGASCPMTSQPAPPAPPSLGRSVGRSVDPAIKPIDDRDPLFEIHNSL